MKLLICYDSLSSLCRSRNWLSVGLSFSQSLHLGVEPLRGQWLRFSVKSKQLRFCLSWNVLPVKWTGLSCKGSLSSDIYICTFCVALTLFFIIVHTEYPCTHQMCPPRLRTKNDLMGLMCVCVRAIAYVYVCVCVCVCVCVYANIFWTVVPCLSPWRRIVITGRITRLPGNETTVNLDRFCTINKEPLPEVIKPGFLIV